MSMSPQGHNPYAAPRNSTCCRRPTRPVPPARGRREYERDPRFLTKLLKAFLWLCLITQVVSIGSNLMQVSFLREGNITEESAAVNDGRQMIIAFTFLGCFIITAIFFLKWMARANRNVRHFGARDLAATPNWAAGSFFIPFVNLWRPYQAMREIWQASRDPLFWKNATAPGILGLWWALWLINGVYGQFTNRAGMGKQQPTIDDLVNITYMEIVGDGLFIFSCLTALAVVSGIARDQEAWVNGKPEPAPLA